MTILNSENKLKKIIQKLVKSLAAAAAKQHKIKVKVLLKKTFLLFFFTKL